MLRRIKLTGDDGKSWPVLLLLLIVVLVPTLGVLGFMDQAMRNERLAIRQKLSDVYLSHLAEIQSELDRAWRQRLAATLTRDESLSPGAQFAALVCAQDPVDQGPVNQDPADQILPLASVIIRGEHGYPKVPTPGSLAAMPLRGLWLDAERLEHQGAFAEAADLYASLAGESTDSNAKARALSRRSRALARGGDRKSAITILIEELTAPEFEKAADHQGRLIAPSSLLRALELIDDAEDPVFDAIARLLHGRLTDYRAPMPSSQRLFLMKALENRLTSAGAESTIERLGTPLFDTKHAEALASRYLASKPPSPAPHALRPSDLPGLWHLTTPAGDLVALLDDQVLRYELNEMSANFAVPAGTRLDLLAPGEEGDDLFLVSLPAGNAFPEWQLVLRPLDQTLFAASASQRIHAYLLTGSLVVVAILLLAILIVRLISRQLRLTRLKNDLLSTVSHELKTPLASIRLLVDTLLESGGQDAARDREYLELIAEENVRLSRLVESFLTFSRYEREHPPLDLRPITAKQVAEMAVGSLAEHLHLSDGGDYQLDVDIDQELPVIEADADALVTVLINLLENAYKYSGDEKMITLRGFLENGHLCLAVSDRGIGLAKQEAKRIFDRFYQVDQSLSRSGSGCGLGLSIVDSLVKAHGGRVDVRSRPGQGSTFTVRLPLPAGGLAVKPDETMPKDGGPDLGR